MMCNVMSFVTRMLDRMFVVMGGVSSEIISLLRLSLVRSVCT